MKFIKIITILFVFISCSTNKDTPSVPQSYSIKGSVFKGSFLRGSTLSFFELDKSLNQTGKSYNTNIVDDYGNFALNAIITSGTLMKVVGDGYFWNEVTNENSSSTLNMNGICKLDSNETINVNVLTCLEKPRVEYLYGKGLSFDSAKSQAVREVLNAFGINNSSIKRAEKVNVVSTNDDSKILLAISTLVQGYRTESEVMQFLSKFSEDLKNDGFLNDTAIGNDLATHLYYIDTATVLNNFRTKYSNLYSTSVLNTLDMRFIKSFLSNVNYRGNKSLIDYPLKGTKQPNFPNILNSNYNIITQNDGSLRSYTLVANIRKGMKLRIEIADQNGNTIPDSFIAPNGPMIFNAYNDAIGWSISKGSNNLGNRPVAIATALYNECFNRFTVYPDTSKMIGGKGTYIVKYFENGTTIPTQTKTIIVQ